GQSRARLDVLANLQEDLLEALVLLLVGENLETLDEGEPGVDHDRELAGEDRENLRRDLAADLGERDLLAPLSYAGHAHVVRAKRSESDVLGIGRQHALLDETGSIATLPDVIGHWSSPLRSLRFLSPRGSGGNRCLRDIQARPTIDELLQFVGIGGTRERNLERDQPPVVERGERLIESLHPELGLPRLHHGIDLVDLVLSDQVANRGVGHEDFHRHDAPFSAGPLEQSLTEDPFEDERELSPDLRLLVRREDVDDAVDGR